MAKVKIQGHASGTGVITLTAPNTSTDRTVTLPDADITLGAGVDGIVSSADATAMTITSAEKIGIGTGSPDSIVEIEGASPILTITDTDASGANFGLWIRELGSHGMPADGTAYGAFLSYKMADNKFQIQMRNGSTTYDSLTVARADGNVGIGQTSPSSANSIPTFLHIGNSSTTQSAIVLEDDESKWEIIHNGDIAFRVGSTAHFRVGSDQIQNGTGVYKINALTSAGITAGWNFDSSGATNISLSQNTAVAITTSLNGSGMILANDTSCTGETAIFVTGGGQMDLIGGTSNSFVNSSSPSTGQIGFYVSGGKAYVKNGMSCTVSLNMQTFRTRTGQ